MAARTARRAPKLRRNYRFELRAGDVLGDGRIFRLVRRSDFAILLRTNGAGDEARTRNFQLGKLNFRSFIFNTYKIAQKKYTCMRCIPCMRCLICVSLRDVLRDDFLPRMPQQTGIESTNPFDDVIQLVEISPSHETLPILPTNIFR